MPLFNKIIRTPPELTAQQRIDHPFIAKVQDKILKYKQQPTDNNNTPAGKVDTLTTEPGVVKNAPVKTTDNNNTPAGKVDTLTTEPGVVKNAPVTGTSVTEAPVTGRSVTTQPLSSETQTIADPEAAQTQPLSSETQTIADPAAAQTQPLSSETQTITDPAAGQIPEPEQTMTGPHTGIGSVDETARQEEENRAIEAAAKEKQDKIKAEIQKLNDDASEEINKLDLQKKVDGITPEEIQKISVEQDAIIDNLFEKLKEYNNKLSGDSTPWPIVVLKKTGGALAGWFERKYLQWTLKSKIADARFELLKITYNKVKQTEKNGGSINPALAQEIADFYTSLEKGIIADSQSPPAPAAAAAGGLPPGAAEAAAAALGGAPPGAAEAAAAALGGAPPGAAEAAAAKALGGEAGAAVAGEAGGAGGGGGGGDGGGDGDKEQGGGGISRKRSHPKYMNQVSENRNKIFKKELEIINSIRQFHRSHTIRKRDKINSILGLRKSRNSKRGANTKNTRRHRHEHQHKHRHNNHKHKSAKHVKKVI